MHVLLGTLSQGDVPEPTTFETGSQMLGNIHEVRKICEGDKYFPAYKYICDCKNFYHNARFCSHIVACYHMDTNIPFNIYDKTEQIGGIKTKRGRPKKITENALLHDATITADSLLIIKKWDHIFHEEYGFGMVDAEYPNSRPPKWRIFLVT